MKFDNVQYHQKFWYIDTRGFRHKQTGEWVSYPDIVPVFVQNIGHEWDGTMTFDIGPVDYSLPENNGKSWQWRRTFYSSNKTADWLFETEDEAREKYETTYSEQQRKAHRTKKEMHFVYDNSVIISFQVTSQEDRDE